MVLILYKISVKPFCVINISPDYAKIIFLKSTLPENTVHPLLKVHLVTGKAHQIRAHLKSTGHPVAGDAKYGHKDLYKTFRREFGLRHQLLHAWRLEFGDFSSIPEKYHGIVLEAPLPKEFKDIMKGLGMDVTALRR